MATLQTAPDEAHDLRPVLLVGPLPPPINGMSVAFSTLVEGLRQLHWAVECISIADPTSQALSGRSSLSRALGVLRAIARTWLASPGCRLLYVTMAQSRMGLLRDLAICALFRVLRKPLVLHMHGGNYREFFDAQPRIIRALARGLLAYATRIVVLSECLRREFDMLPDWQEKTLVVVNPCTVQVCRPRTHPEGLLRLLYLSNLVVEKGYRDVALALPEIAAGLPGWRIEAHFAGAFQVCHDVFADTASMQRDFDTLGRSLPPSASLTWHGVVAGEAKHRLLSSCDVFVLPTYYRNEGQPISIIEAMAYGLPVISTPFRAIPEMLPPSLADLAVAPRQASHIAQRVVRLALDGVEYERLSVDAVNRAQFFDPDLHIRRMAALLSPYGRSPHASCTSDPG